MEGRDPERGGDEQDDSTLRLKAARRTAESIVELLRELERRADSLAMRNREIAERARDTEASLARLQAFDARVAQAAFDGVVVECVKSAADLVDALVKKPNDLLVMVKISEQAETLAAILAAHARVVDILQSAEQ